VLVSAGSRRSSAGAAALPLRPAHEARLEACSCRRRSRTSSSRASSVARARQRRAASGRANALEVAADVTQALVAVSVTYVVVGDGGFGFFQSASTPRLSSASAKFAQARRAPRNADAGLRSPWATMRFPKKPASADQRVVVEHAARTPRSRATSRDLPRGRRLDEALLREHEGDGPRQAARPGARALRRRHHDDLVPRAEAPVPGALSAACTASRSATTGARAAWRASAAPRRAPRSASSSRRGSTRRATSGAATSAFR
jgi:hypothetical protein